MNIDLYSTGQYGVVDLYYRNVWINTYSEKIAHEVRRTFWSKASTMVLDLTCFVNYTETLVDSDVALDWKIQHADLLSPVTTISLSNRELEKTQTTYMPNTIVNESNTTMLEKSRQLDLQQQMLFYVFLLKKIHWDNTEYNKDEQQFIDQIRQIVQTELSLSSIKEKIIKLSGVSITGPRCAAVTILNLLNSKYE
jgi:hypothetical protein